MKAKPKKTVVVKKEWQSSLDSFFSTTEKKTQAECVVAATTAPDALVNTVVAATNAIDATATSQANSQLLSPEGNDAILPQPMCRKRAREKDEVPGNSGHQRPRVSFDLPASAASEGSATAEITEHETPSLAVPDIQMAEMRLSDRLDTDTANDSNGATVAAQVGALAVSAPNVIDLDPNEPDDQQAQDISMPQAPELKVEQDKEGTKIISVEKQAEAVPVRVTNAGGRNPGTYGSEQVVYSTC